MAVSENVSSCSMSAMWDWSHLSLSGTPPALSLLDAATDLLVLERNFAGSLELCERGLQIIKTEPKETKCEQAKTSLCIIGIQSLAELGRWREVLPWIMEHYRTPQEMPHNVMEMCILLYGKVNQPRVMLELSSDWLKLPANQQLPGYSRVAELHLIHILLPLGLICDAEDLVGDSSVFDEKQRVVALTAVDKHRKLLQLEEEKLKTQDAQLSQSESEAKRQTGNMLTNLLLRILGLVARLVRKVPFRNLSLALLLIAIILLRLDPGTPVCYGPMSNLLLLLRNIISGVSQKPPIRQR
ncbi:hypothetical protein GDO86_005077 [Hymenochirus boettgeri]|uniref:Peroxisome assembly protein 26 n=1 Tax=Hymenochirus boettgeri TaxID=247094 RepID=A0A8T2J5M5_9PIPI|nr:hypothetical protein GDO86_005077 [Hymenochirus boettgeri]